MRCLVTGGAGFIGSHLCDRLLKSGYEVICVDNLLTGSRNNIKHLLPNARFQFLQFDCIKPLPKSLTAEIIFHLASPASPNKYQQFPLETLLVNTLGTYHLLEMATAQKIPFIFASTSEIYGDPQEHPQKETYWGHVNPVGSRSCYDEGKRAGETFVATYRQKYGVRAKICRIFNTYGPRMDINDGRVIANFIKQVLYKEPLTVYGNGKQTRSFCYVSDLVEGLMLIANSWDDEEFIYNLGNPEELTVLELLKKIRKLTHYSGKVVHADLPDDDPKQRRPDITRMKRLGWRPVVTLEAGLKKTIDYFKHIYIP